MISILEDARQRRLDALRTPAFPEDIVHYDDGGWDCSPASREILTRTFQDFGLDLGAMATFQALYDSFAFVSEAACLLSCLGKGPVEREQSAEMLNYLHALKDGGRDNIQSALSALPPRISIGQATNLMGGSGRPALRLVR